MTLQAINPSRPFSERCLAAMPTKRAIKTGLLGLTVATTILSLIPPFRLAGALATRSIAFLSSSLDSVKPNEKGISAKALNCARTAFIALGIAGLAAASPVLILTSLVADTGIQVIEMGKAIYKKQAGKALVHLSCIVINSLVIGALIVGSWKLMVAAAAVSMVVMGVFAMAISIGKDKPTMSSVFESFCYLGLSVTSALSLGAVIQETRTVNTNSRFTVENTSKEKVAVFDKNGQNVATVEPGETRQVEVPFADTLQHLRTKTIPDFSNGSVSFITVREGSYVNVCRFDATQTAMEMTKLDATAIDSQSIITKQPLAPEHFPTLPLGSNVVAHPLTNESI